MAVASSVLRSYGDTDFITGLRAIAATLVVIIHTAAFSDFGPVGQAVTSAGKYGVEMFFVISGFTIARTYSEAVDYKSYLTRRLMRILPLYWVVISVATLLLLTGGLSRPYWMQEFGSEPDFYNYVMHISMLSFLDFRIANSLLGVEWTIPIEVFWYVFLPFAVMFCKTIGRATFAIVLVLIATALLGEAAKALWGVTKAVSWSPIAHGHLFIMGVLAFHLRDRFRLERSAFHASIIAGCSAAFVIALMWDISGRSAVIALCTAASIVFVTPNRAPWLTKVLTFRPMLFLGSISYSIYLIHMLVHPALKDWTQLQPSGLGYFLVVYGLTVGCSTATYLLIEKPTNTFGRRLAQSPGDRMPQSAP